MLRILMKLSLIWTQIALLTFVGCGNPKIIEDMAQLDQAFIPLLYGSEHGETTTLEAIQLFDRFVRRWNLFYGNYHTANQINPNWGQGLDQINQKVQAVEDSLVDRHSISGIHTILESIRRDLMQLRHQNQIAYALDEVSAFHDIMAPMWEAAVKIETEPENAEQYVAPILNNMAAAEKQWMRVQMVRFDPMLYKFTEDDEAQLKLGIKTVQSTLSDLNSAISNHDTLRMAELAKKVKPGFVKIYLLFGSFGSPL